MKFTVEVPLAPSVMVKSFIDTVRPLEWPRFIVESGKLEKARNVSNPLSVTRCLPSYQPCRIWMREDDFYSEWNGGKGILRPDVMMHYSGVLFDSHFHATGKQFSF